MTALEYDINTGVKLRMRHSCCSENKYNTALIATILYLKMQLHELVSYECYELVNFLLGDGSSRSKSQLLLFQKHHRCLASSLAVLWSFVHLK